jgi:hypothetical protein
MPNIAMSPEQTKSTEPTPEQLMRLIDLQIEAQRARRAQKPKNRATFIAVGLLFIIFAAFASLMLLSQMVQDLPHPERASEPAFEASDSH